MRRGRQGDARRELNRESLELWLVTRGQHNSTRPPSHPDEYHGKVGKRGSRVGQDDIWLQAISQPDAIETDRFFSRCMAYYALGHPLYHAILVSYSRDPSITVSSDAQSLAIRRFFEPAINGILDIADNERRILYWPSPDDAKGYVEDNTRKRREALYHYHCALDNGDSPTLAVKRAALAARCTQRAVWRWVSTERATYTRERAEEA